MNIYLCTLEHDIIVEYIDEWGRSEQVCEWEFVVALTRGKARATFVDHVNEDFTHPMSIKKVKHNILQYNLKEGVLPHGYYVDENYNLLYGPDDKETI